MDCSSKIQIKYPSDFKVRINSITGKNGDPISPDDIYMAITYRDKSGRTYDAVWDPDGVDTKNIVKHNDDGLLYVIFENYQLKGDLEWKIDTRVSGESADDFSDGKWNVYGSYKPAKITIVE